MRPRSGSARRPAFARAARADRGGPAEARKIAGDGQAQHEPGILALLAEIIQVERVERVESILLLAFESMVLELVSGHDLEVHRIKSSAVGSTRFAK